MSSKHFLVTLCGVFALIFTSQIVFGQGSVNQNKGVVFIAEGEVVYSKTNFTNDGQLTNDGNLLVEGDVKNSGSYISSGKDTLRILGASSSILETNGDTIGTVWIEKDTYSDSVTVQGAHLHVTNGLQLASGSISTDPTVSSHEVIAPMEAKFEFHNGAQIIGSVRRTGWKHESSAVVFHNDATSIITDNDIAPSEVVLTVIPEANGGEPTSDENEIKRFISFGAVGGGSGFTATLVVPYEQSELDGISEEGLLGIFNNAGNWMVPSSCRYNFDTLNNVATIEGITPTYAGEWKLGEGKGEYNLKVYLEGPWNASLNELNTTVNSILPLESPYDTLPWSLSPLSVSSIPSTDVVDWILVELRKPSSGLAPDASSATVVGQSVGFILKDGTIVNPDGSFPLDVNASVPGPYYIVVRHRNHLSVMTNSSISKSGSFYTHDFTTAAGQGYGTDPQKEIATGVYGMWSGDVNADGIIKYNLGNNDRSYIFNRIGGGNINVKVYGYYPEDLNLDGVVKYNLGNNDRTIILNNIGGTSLNSKRFTQVPF